MRLMAVVTAVSTIAVMMRATTSSTTVKPRAAVRMMRASDGAKASLLVALVPVQRRGRLAGGAGLVVGPRGHQGGAAVFPAGRVPHDRRHAMRIPEALGFDDHLELPILERASHAPAVSKTFG